MTFITDLYQWNVVLAFYCTPKANVGKTSKNLHCIYYINSNLLISFIDESRKIKAVTRTSSYRRKGEQTFMLHLFGSIREFGILDRMFYC